MNIVKQLKEIESEHVEGEGSHIAVDDLLYNLLDLDEESRELITKLSPWYA